MAQGMNKLNEALVSLPEVRELLLSLDAGTSPIAVSGLSGVHRAQLAAAVRHKTQRPLLMSARTKTRQTAWRATCTSCSART